MPKTKNVIEVIPIKQPNDWNDCSFCGRKMLKDEEGVMITAPGVIDYDVCNPCRIDLTKALLNYAVVS